MRRREESKATIAVAVVVVVMVLCGVIAHSFYMEFIYKRTPEYVHENLTPPYEEEAEEFFYEHEAELFELAEMQEELDSGANYLYEFNLGPNAESNIQDRQDAVPHEILSVLQRIENKTDCTYSIGISQGQIRVWICSSTNFDVYLYHGEIKHHSMTGDDKTTQLEGGWTIEAPYQIRS